MKNIKKILEIAYEVQVETFSTPDGDRYQILTQHKPFEMQILDTGLGINRSKEVILFNLVTRPRSTKAKKAFYDKLTYRLQEELSIKKSDVIFSLVPNDDWSFGNGEAQFLSYIVISLTYFKINSSVISNFKFKYRNN